MIYWLVACLIAKFAAKMGELTIVLTLLDRRN